MKNVHRMFKVMFSFSPSQEESTWFCHNVQEIGLQFSSLIQSYDTVNYVHMVTYHAADDLRINKSLYLFGNDVQETVNYHMKKVFENLSDRKDFLLAGMKRSALPMLISVEANLRDLQDMYPGRTRKTQDFQQVYHSDVDSEESGEESSSSMEED